MTSWFMTLDGDVVRGQEREQHDRQPRRPRVRAGQPERRRGGHRGAEDDAADEDHVRVPQHPPVQRLGGRRAVAGLPLQLREAPVRPDRSRRGAGADPRRRSRPARRQSRPRCAPRRPRRCRSASRSARPRGDSGRASRTSSARSRRRGRRGATASITLCRSTNTRQSIRAMVRRLVMLFAIMIWVSATRCVERAAASSALSASSVIHSASRVSVAEPSGAARSWRRRRETNVGVSGGCWAMNSLNTAPSLAGPSSLAATTRSPQRSALSSSSSRCTVRSAMRRTFSIRPRRSIAGMAHSSPMRERGDFLERGDEQIDVAQVHPALAVRDERDRQLVDPRISRRAGRRSARAAPGSSRGAGSRGPRGCAPAPRGNCRAASRRPGPDVDVVLGGGGKPGVGVVEDAAGLVESLEEAGPPRPWDGARGSAGRPPPRARGRRGVRRRAARPGSVRRATTPRVRRRNGRGAA